MYYQHRFLNSHIFDSRSQIFKLFILFVSLLFINGLLTFIGLDRSIQILVVIFASFILTLVLYRYQRIFSTEDIYRYGGSRNKISKFLTKISCKPSCNDFDARVLLIKKGLMDTKIVLSSVLIE